MGVPLRVVIGAATAPCLCPYEKDSLQEPCILAKVLPDNVDGIVEAVVVGIVFRQREVGAMGCCERGLLVIVGKRQARLDKIDALADDWVQRQRMRKLQTGDTHMRRRRAL